MDSTTITTQLKLYAVTITDTVKWHGLIPAVSEDDAHTRAWDVFAGPDREAEFTDRSERNLTAEEVLI